MYIIKQSCEPLINKINYLLINQICFFKLQYCNLCSITYKRNVNMNIGYLQTLHIICLLINIETKAKLAMKFI